MKGLRAGVLFDIDGTLVDSNYLHTLAWSRALASAGEWAPMNAIHRLIGMGGDQLVPSSSVIGASVATAARPDQYKQLIDEVSAFPGAQDLLWRLHTAGLLVVLATSAPNHELEYLLKTWMLMVRSRRRHPPTTSAPPSRRLKYFAEQWTSATSTRHVVSP